MGNLKKKLNEILADIDQNIKNKDDLEYIKSQIYNISILFLDEIDKIAEMNLGRLNVMLEREKELSRKMSNLEKVIENIEREMYISSDCDFEIICPYCNEEFYEDFSEGVKSEVRCPKCDNIIELDWHEEDECGCGHCHHHHEEDDEDEEEFDDENDDDM